MAFLPERHRHLPPQRWERFEERHSRPLARLEDTEWRITSQRRSSLSSVVTFIAAAVAGLAAGYFAWSFTRDAIPVRPVRPASHTSAPTAPLSRYANPGDPIGPNFENWRNRNHSGVTPTDVFGFNRDGGRR